MSLKDYDIAMIEKLKAVFDNVILSNSEESIMSNASKCGEQAVVKLPLVSIIRTNNPLNTEQFYNYRQVHSGKTLYKKDDGVVKGADRLKILPININYQIDIRSDRRVEVDGIWRELCMYLLEKPEIDVKFDCLEELESFPLMVMDTDNTTDVESFDERGRLWRQTITVEIPQAKLIFRESAGRLVREIPVRVVAVNEL